MKFSFSIETENKEVFRVDDAHSFDEAIKVVERGVYERGLEISSRLQALRASQSALRASQLPKNPTAAAALPKEAALPNEAASSMGSSD